jgi:hypothetical protein
VKELQQEESKQAMATQIRLDSLEKDVHQEDPAAGNFDFGRLSKPFKPDYGKSSST